MITEKKYPPILWSSYHQDSSPKDIEIASFDLKGLNYIKNTDAFTHFVGLLGFDYFQGNTLEMKIKKEKVLPKFQPHRHFYLSEKAFHKIEFDMNFRKKMFQNGKLVASSSGTITFKNGGCYMYRILNPDDSQTHKKANFTDCEILSGSRYFAIAIFFEDNFMAFEEGTISTTGEIRLNEDKGFYQPNHDLGQYITFTLITLSAFYFDFLKSKVLPPQSGLNLTNQSINFLDV